MSELFKNLESNNPQLAEDAKNELIKSLNQTKENWLVYGIMEHYAAQKKSTKVVDILVKVQNETHIFDKLQEWISSGDRRNKAFELFWLIVERHPSWLYRVTHHRLFRDMLNVVKTERNITTTLNGLFCIVILLPIIPGQMNEHLPDLFTIFIILANWKATNTPELIGNQPVYLQNGIERLFQRLYGMYPCNFFAFLRDNMNEKTRKVIDPLVKNTRMHPRLLFSNTDMEKNQSRWKEMEPHDVVHECDKFALDYAVKGQEGEPERHETPWYGRSIQVAPNQLLTNDRHRHMFAPIAAIESASTKQKAKGANKWDIWSPSNAVLATPPPTNTLAITHTPTPMISQTFIQSIPGSQQYSSSGASPPEAAVEGKLLTFANYRFFAMNYSVFRLFHNAL